MSYVNLAWDESGDMQDQDLPGSTPKPSSPKAQAKGQGSFGVDAIFQLPHQQAPPHLPLNRSHPDPSEESLSPQASRPGPDPVTPRLSATAAPAGSHITHSPGLSGTGTEV